MKKLLNMSRTWTDAMIRDIFIRSRNKKKILNTQWQRIPAVNSFVIKLSEFNPALAAIGIMRRMPNDLKITSHDNRHMNRYMEYSIRRLRKLKGTREYWKITYALLTTSVSFRVSAINRVYPAWYKSHSRFEIFRLNAQVSKIFRDLKDEIDIRRVYIPKSENKFRPLGVPSPQWRIALHMFTNFMGIYFEDSIGGYQHAFRPGKGCLSAWRELFSKLEKPTKYIYEFDLTNCFNLIDGAYLENLLIEKYKIPKRIVYFINNLNMSVPKLPEELMVDESLILQKRKIQQKKWWEEFKDVGLHDTYLSMTPEDQSVVWDILLEEGFTSLDEFLQTQVALLREYMPVNVGNAQTGLPQGCNMSPLLTILVLEEYFKNKNCTLYADDGIVFSDEPIEMVDDPDKGIIINREKSGYIRYEGKWLKDIHFLGLNYNPITGELSGKTRKGSLLSLRTDNYEERIFKLMNILSPEYNSMKEVMTSSLGGNIISALYSGTWDKMLDHWDVVKYGVKTSWLRLIGKGDNFVTTSSHACAFLGATLKKMRLYKNLFE